MSTTRLDSSAQRTALRLWPGIAAALRDTAVSLGQLFGAPRSSWEGAPPSLGSLPSSVGEASGSHCGTRRTPSLRNCARRSL